MQKEETVQRTSRASERRAARPLVIDPAQLYSIFPEYCACREISRAGAYHEIGQGLIKTVKEGGRRKIMGSEIIRRIREVAGDSAA